jgi:hypothetical protein
MATDAAISPADEELQNIVARRVKRSGQPPKIAGALHELGRRA